MDGFSLLLGIVIVLGSIVYIPWSKPNPTVIGVCAVSALVVYFLFCAAIAFFLVPAGCVAPWLECYYDSLSAAFYFPIDVIDAIAIWTSYLLSR